MYSVLCLVLVSATMVWGKASFISIPPEQLVDLLNVSMDCMTKTGVQPETMQKIISWNFENTEPVRKYIYCFSKTSGFADENGYLVKERVMKLVGNHKKRNQFGDVIDECNKTKGSDKYETMFKTAVCFYEKSPILFTL